MIFIEPVIDYLKSHANLFPKPVNKAIYKLRNIINQQKVGPHRNKQVALFKIMCSTHLTVNFYCHILWVRKILWFSNEMKLLNRPWACSHALVERSITKKPTTLANNRNDTLSISSPMRNRRWFSHVLSGRLS